MAETTKFKNTPKSKPAPVTNTPKSQAVKVVNMPKPAPAQFTNMPKTAPKTAKKASTEVSKGFAVIMTGGKQYRVKVGQNLKIEKILGEHKEGDTLVFDQVLMKDDGADTMTLGTPTVKGSTVSSTITKISRYKTVDVIHYKQKSRYFKKYGHRQPYFEVKIDSIN